VVVRIAGLNSTKTMPSTARRLLLCSLALNLAFVVGATIVATSTSSSLDGGAFVRVERLATVLAPADASSLRTWAEVNRTAIQDAQMTYQAAQQKVREALRQEPFNITVLWAAMANARVARQKLDQIMEAVIVSAVAQMSLAGRLALASQNAHHGYPNTH